MAREACVQSTATRAVIKDTPLHPVSGIQQNQATTRKVHFQKAAHEYFQLFKSANAFEMLRLLTGNCITPSRSLA